MYDVAIIGGGIAGLTLSLDLARKGHSVVVVEKGNYPRHKVCGEYLSMESRRYLTEICPELENIQTPFINEFLLSSTGTSQFKTKLNQGGFGISRYLLEELLYKEAKKQGVFFYLNTVVTDVRSDDSENYRVVTREVTVKSKVVCNATGRKSNLTFNNKRNNINYVGVKYHVRIKRNESLIEIHNFPGGYCGISNVEEGKSCLCYIVNAAKIRSAGTIKAMEETILFKNKSLKRIFNEADFLFETPLTVSGIDFRKKNTANDTVLHLGDSAGTIAPVTGNGMSMALRSAFQLSNIIQEYLNGGADHTGMFEKYSNYWDENFQKRVNLSRYFQRLSEYPALTGTTIGIFNLLPRVADFVIKQTYGKPF